jgi:hypothetical protein
MLAKIDEVVHNARMANPTACRPERPSDADFIEMGKYNNYLILNNLFYIS